MPLSTGSLINVQITIAPVTAVIVVNGSVKGSADKIGSATTMDDFSPSAAGEQLPPAIRPCSTTFLSTDRRLLKTKARFSFEKRAFCFRLPGRSSCEDP